MSFPECPPAMVDPTLPLPGLSPIEGKAIVARFDGGRLSSDGGLLVLREIERRLKVAERLAACIDDPRDPDNIVHTVADIIRFRLLMIAAGYEDGNDATGLRTDPVFKLALERLGPGPVFAVDHLAAGEPAGCADAAAPGPGSGRRLLQLVPPGAEAHRPRYRRHLRCGAWRPAVAPVQRPLRRIRLPADRRLRCRWSLRHRPPAPGQAAEGRRDPGVSAPPHPRDPSPLAAGGDPPSRRQPLRLPGRHGLVRDEQPRLRVRPRPH